MWRSLTIIILIIICLVIHNTKADLHKPISEAEVNTIINDNKPNSTILLFLDSREFESAENAEDEKNNEEGFMSSFFGSVKGMFVTNSLTPNEIGDLLSKSFIVLKFDINNPNFTKLKEKYKIQNFPYLVILKDDKVVFEGVPSSKNIDEIKTKLSNLKNPAVQASQNENQTAGSVVISPVKTDIKNGSNLDPYYFGDNIPTYEEKFYKDGMNGGIIGKLNGVDVGMPLRDADYDVKPSKDPYERLSSIKEISYYGDNKPTPQTEIIKKIEIAIPEIKEVVEEPTEMCDVNLIPTEVKNVDLTPTEIKNVDLTPTEVIKVDLTPTIVKDVDLTPTIIKNVDITPTVIRKVELKPEIVSRPVIPTPVANNHVHKKKVCILEDADDVHDEKVEVKDTPKIVYHEIIEGESEPKNYVAIQKVKNEFDIDDKWKKVLQDEKDIISEINKLYKDDKELAKTLRESENEIRESEEMFNRARASIEATLKESEKQMQEYESKLEELYQARQLALKAKEDLYHPCDNKCKLKPQNTIPPPGGIIQKRLSGPYIPVRRPTPPSDQSNFHDLYESIRHQSVVKVPRKRNN